MNTQPKKITSSSKNATWAWQPFGPQTDIYCFAALGSHYRGFAVIKIDNDAKACIEQGKPVVFQYRGVQYLAENGTVKPTQPESERVTNLADAIPTNTDAVQADPNHQPALVKLPPRPETYVLENASDGILWRVYHSPTNGSLCLSFSTSGNHHPDLKAHMAQFAVGEIVHIMGGRHGEIVDVMTKVTPDFMYSNREFFYLAYGLVDTNTGTRYYVSEGQLLDYGNPRDIHANAVTAAYDYHYQGGQYRPPAQSSHTFDTGQPATVEIVDLTNKPKKD